MKSIRILITRHYDFDQTHHTELWFRSIQSEFSKYFSIDLIWLLYLPEKIIVKNFPNNENVEYIQDFNNALDVIKKVKPDLIISSEYPSLIDLAFLAASKNSDSLFIKNESEAVYLNHNSNQKISTGVKISRQIPFFTSLFSLFGVPSMSQLAEKNHVTLNRIKFLFYKLNFLFSTLFFSKLRTIQKWNFLSAGLGYLFRQTYPYLNPKLYPDIDFCNTISMGELMTKNNYSHSGLFVVGEPIYDNLFKKRNQPSSTKISKKIQVLFAPTGFSGSTNQKIVEDALMVITKEISQNKKRFNLFVKLHPSSHPFEYYKKYIHSIDDSVLIFQKGGIESYVERSDILVTFTDLTSVFLYPLILRKPVIFCNFHNGKLPEGVEDLVFVCTDPAELQNNILEALETNHKKYQKIDEYLETACFKTDGLASERIVQSIISLMNNPSEN